MNFSDFTRFADLGANSRPSNAALGFGSFGALVATRRRIASNLLFNGTCGQMLHGEHGKVRRLGVTMSEQLILSDPSVHVASFQSILFRESAVDGPTVRCEAPDFFGDLNLDQIVASVTSGREEYDLQPFFHTSLRRVCDVNYRYEILRDLYDPGLLGCVRAFAQDSEDDARSSGKG